MTKSRVLILLIFLILFISCEKKDLIEIFLTKNRIESYDGKSLKSSIKDSLILDRITNLYGDNLRYDSIKDRIIYMGRFNAVKSDLQLEPFIKDSEILELDVSASRIYFKEMVQNRIYDSLPKWTKEGGFVGRQFVICLNGKIVSNGYFDSMWDRFECKTNTIFFYHDKYDSSKKVGFLIDSANIELSYLKKNSSFISAFKSRIKK